ncbi:MAG: hypothetical protein DMF78_22160 [Acidobacteria bacterium]|nr:MAG: hypothetical protein DMF78_22160 [Acidobacteriota bacterium]
MRALPALIVLLAASAPGSPTLGRLADAAAAEVARAAAGRPVELSASEDRTGAPTLAADLDALVRARLQARLTLSTAGPRVRVVSVLAQVGPRLTWSARVTEEPSGAPVDVLAVSTPWDPGLLPLVPSRTSGGAGVDVLAHVETPPLEGRIVALAFAGEDRLLVLLDDALVLYRRDGLALRLESRRELPGPLAVVRFPGGLLRVADGESACWALTSRMARAVLFSLDGARLSAVDQADVVPWPSTAAGARFRPGTNLIEASLPGVDAPLLALDTDAAWIVAADGRLSRAGALPPPETALRVGPAVALLWPGLVAAAAGDAPAEHDRIVFVRDAATPALAGELSVEGTLRALAARRHGATALLAAATEERGGGFRVALFEIAERKP